MVEYKLVFTGTTGAGKTTAINVISEIAPISTDVANSDATIGKSHTTVGLDFGQITLANGDRVRLFGTPGQTRFDFMWRILVKDAFGLIILIDNSRPDPLKDLELYIEGFLEEINSIPCVIGIGRSESYPSPSLDDFAEKLIGFGITLPILPVDVRRVDDVIMLIDVLMAQSESELV